MKLSVEDRRMLDGGSGAALQEAMQYLVELGEVTEADEIVDVHSAHWFGDWRTLGPAGLEVYERFAAAGAKVRVPTSCELFSYDRNHPHEFGLTEDYFEYQPRVMETLKTLGVPLYASCIFYLTQNICRYGDNLAWIEGNATGYANSFVGARGNRENAITCLMAALTGRIPRYGLLNPENRRGEVLIELGPGLVEKLGGEGRISADFCALGAAIGDRAYDRVPVVTGFPKKVTTEQLKAISSICSPSLAGTLVFVVGLSPEAPTVEAAFRGKVPKDVERHRITLKDVQVLYEGLCNAERREIDGVITGCPLKTIHEVQEVANRLEGRRVRSGVFMWVLTDMTTWYLAKESGLVDRIERSGARVYHDVCPYTLPVEEVFGAGKVIASDSMKMIRLAAGPGKPRFWFGTLRDCVEAAATGRFESRRWS